MEHITEWLHQVASIKTSEGKDIEVWELNHQTNQKILSAWAKHFREQYCLDNLLDRLRSGTGLTRSNYLLKMSFPDQRDDFGPSIRAGDFGELLVSDYLEFAMNYWVPRLRMKSKSIQNESVKGSDVIGFKFSNQNYTDSPQDELAIYECKATLSDTTLPADSNRLQDAVNDSMKDDLRKAVSLNFLKARLIEKGDQTSSRIERFQNSEDRPYTEINGAAAILTTTAFNKIKENLQNTKTNSHPNQSGLKLLVISGDDLMAFVHALFQRAADEA